MMNALGDVWSRGIKYSVQNRCFLTASPELNHVTMQSTSKWRRLRVHKVTESKGKIKGVKKVSHVP